ncbi:unnamed protein product [Effrenium voratum]|uniref:TNFR-Cys domain-containing protein n=2 Tax=Effrenium voratum TaxID=2562239 RepID=A0AA36I2I9_9DINO|nr:unnamed protein product [Effrenium voratum]CAJ1460026.1 unnamed protein product [Effrenium voratum]
MTSFTSFHISLSPLSCSFRRVQWTILLALMAVSSAKHMIHRNPSHQHAEDRGIRASIVSLNSSSMKRRKMNSTDNRSVDSFHMPSLMRQLGVNEEDAENCRLHCKTCAAESGLCSVCDHSMSLDPTSGNCVAVCPLGFFSSRGPSRTCVSCGGSCNRCQEAAQCLECKHSMYLTPNNTCELDCPIGFYKHGIGAIGRTCLPCSPNCNSCSDWFTCDECTVDAYITTDAACETTCPDGYYGEGNGVSGGLCRACDPKCTKCSGPLVCNECRGSRYLTPFFQCETSCPVGSYPHGEGKVGRACLPCPLGCASCTSEDTCLECTDDFFLAADQVCTKSCPDGFYGADSRDSVCTSFFAKRYNLGTFSEAASGMTDTVMMVSDTNPDKCCAACAAAEGCGGFEIVDGKCYMKGDLSKLTRQGSQTYYEKLPRTHPVFSGATRFCTPCPSHCSSCTMDGQCTECSASRSLSFRALCSAECPPGYFKNGTNEVGNICPECISACSQCESEHVCTECREYKFLTPNSTCEADCPDGYWPNGTMEVGGLCSRCREECIKCTSNDICTECAPFHFLTPDMTCSKTCPDGYYPAGDPSESGGLCTKCVEPCLLCTSAERCLRCGSFAFLTQNFTCEDECPRGFFSNYPHQDVDQAVGRTCLACRFNEENCQNALDQKAKLRRQAASLEEDSDAPPEEEFTILAKQCKNGRFLTPDSSCVEREYCWPPHINRRYPKMGMVDKNRSEDGLIGGECAECPDVCNQCELLEKCTECRHSLYLTPDDQCKATCPATHYPNNPKENDKEADSSIGRECVLCEGNCSTCTTKTECTQCKNGAFLSHKGECNLECPDGYYEERPAGGGAVGGTCVVCPGDCNTCENAEVCTSCKNRALLYKSQCLRQCPRTHFPKISGHIGGECHECKGHCSECQTDDNCMQCKPGAYLQGTSKKWLGRIALSHKGLKKTCEKSCPVGFYPAKGKKTNQYWSRERGVTGLFGGTCDPCHKDCYECVDGETCLKCWNSKYLTAQSECVAACPAGTWGNGTDAIGRTCDLCSANCSSCISDQQCTECKNSQILGPDGTCSDDCPDGFYVHSSTEDNPTIGSFCLACPENCAKCDSPEHCTECKSATYLTYDNTCDEICPDGYFGDGTGDTGRICKTCSDDCNRCAGNSVCFECKNHKFLTPSDACDSECPEGYYPDFSGEAPSVGGICIPCPDGCASCDGPDSCTVCADSKYLNSKSRIDPSNTCVAKCSDGNYGKTGNKDGTYGTCEQCPSECATCVSADECLSCIDGYKFSKGDKSCSSPCDAGSFKNDKGKCQKCASGCAMCVNAFLCTECTENLYVTADMTCEADCPHGYYGVGVKDKGRKCQRCKPHCSKCVSGDQCTECTNRKYLTHLETCESLCPTGYYPYSPNESLPTGGICFPCPPSCVACESPDRCTVCNNNTYLTDDWKCSETCPVHFYGDGTRDVGRTCTKCEEDCAKCVSEDLCLECKNGKLLTPQGVCKARCPAGYYPSTPAGAVGVGGECLPCADNCWKCTGSHTCQVCSEDAYLTSDSLCVEECPVGFYGVGSGAYMRTCQPCAEHCSQCIGAENCTECVSDMFLTPSETCGKTCPQGLYPSLQLGKSFGTCEPCSANCSSCITPTICTGCQSYQYLNPDSTCGATCGRGYFYVMPENTGGVGGYCQPCGNHASTCINETVATLCKDDTYHSSFTYQCDKTCGAGEYPLEPIDGVGGECRQCNSNCSLCTSATSCTQCRQYTFLNPDDWCRDTCPDGYYADNGTDGVGGLCKLCPPTCNLCNSADYCTECKRYTFRTPDFKCESECPDNYWEFGMDVIGGTCEMCAENCSKCISDTQCTECNNSMFLERSGECVEHCPDGDFNLGADPDGRTCQKCPPQFNLCINASFASECKSSLYLTPNGKCEERCPSGFYPRGESEIGRFCPRCATNCSQCDDARTCTVCQNRQFLTPWNWCEEDCPASYYKSGNASIGNTCEKCEAYCRTCTDEHECTECSDNKYLTPGRNCEALCPDNFFELGSGETGRTCPPCERNCHKCESATLCTECNNSMYLDADGNCVQTCPDGFYHDGMEDRGRTCKECDASCSKCSSWDVCLECAHSMYLTPNSTCQAQCPDSYYHNGTGDFGRSCPICAENCSQCTDANTCTECRNFTYLAPDDWCHSDCPVGYYEYGTEYVGGLCNKCSDNCQECTSQSVCLVCGDEKYLDPTSSTCKTLCPDGYFANAGDNLVIGRTCERCPSTCNTCDSASDCRECKDSTVLTPSNTCEEFCPPSFYPNVTGDIGGICLRCADNCNACDDKEVCAQCKMHLHLTPFGNCSASCPTGYYAKPGHGGLGGACPLCSENCSQCTSADVCTECRNSTFLTPMSTCAAVCPPGYYSHPDGEIGGTCNRCAAGCNVCDSPEVCTQCKNHTFLQPDGTCAEACPVGYYMQEGAGGIGGTCPLCAENCSQCTGAAECTECRNSTHLTPYGWCAEECPDGSYEMGSASIGRTCPLCPPSCNTCESDTYCTECKNSTYLLENKCEASCPTGLFAKRSGSGDVGGVCEKCSDTCVECISDGVCTKCTAQHFLSPSGDCADECPYGHFKEKGEGFVGGTCPMCPENCATCDSREKCTSCRGGTLMTSYHQCRSYCPAGYYGLFGTCYECPGSCNLCSSPEECTECKDGAYLTPTGTCEQECPTGYHERGEALIGRYCTTCPWTCLDCISDDECTMCKNHSFLTPHKMCDFTCPDHFYKDGDQEIGNECKICLGDASKCISADYSSECKNGMYLTPSASCDDVCPKGYYPSGIDLVGRSCALCAENCSACTDATVCTECKNSKYLTAAKWCQADCPAGFYGKGDGLVGRECIQCDHKCNLCTAADVCVECKNHAFLTPDSKCEEACPDGYWAKPGVRGIGGMCEPCPSTCFKCLSPLQCTVCKDQYYLEDEQCIATCPDGEYHVGDTNIGRVCEPCPSKCKSCVSPEVCTECEDSTFLNPDSTCQSTCPDGFYNNFVGETGSNCPACHENCNLCLNATYCTECRNSTYLTPSGTCEAKCPDGYYGDGDDAVGRICKPCAETCNKCLSETHCTECRLSTYLNPVTHFCDLSCPAGYYNDGTAAIGRTCPPCVEHCGKCESRDWCTECKNFKYMTAKRTCEDSCGDGLYKQGTSATGNTCQSCSKDCSKCSSLELCTECANSTYLTSTHHCAGECSTGFLETGDMIKGRTCEALCFWCD